MDTTPEYLPLNLLEERQATTFMSNVIMFGHLSNTGIYNKGVGVTDSMKLAQS